MRKSEQPDTEQPTAEIDDAAYSSEFSDDIQDNLKTLHGIIADSNDVVFRSFTCEGEPRRQAVIFYVDGMIDKELVNENIIKPLMYKFHTVDEEPADTDGIDYAESALVFVGDLKKTTTVSDAVDGFLSGDTVLLIDGSPKALILSLRGWKSRGVEEPQTESVVRGSREGFTETLRFNTALIRRKIKNPHLVMEMMTLGVRTKTDVCITYINNLTSPSLIGEVKSRLQRINTDAILESGYIEQFIEDEPFSIFATVGNSEKPDKVAAKMLEGRVAILVDGTPFVLTVPNLFFESFQSSEDYYSRTIFASIIRIIRYIAYIISVSAPAVYVALSSFHQEMLPTPLLLTMASAHEGVPFPAVVEAMIMLVSYEILKEAGVRLPRPIGQAVSIVGALVIGEAAVSAGLIGAPMVIVVAITAVSSFVVPPQTDSGAVIRFLLLIMAGVMGGYGIVIGILFVFIHMASLRSFGTPYLSGLAPYNASDMKDVFIRAPIWAMNKRPKDIHALDKIRQGKNLKPGPPNDVSSASDG